MRTYEPTEQRLRAKRRAAEEAAASLPRAGQDEDMSEPEKSSDEAS